MWMCAPLPTVIADWTGVPLSSLMKDEQTELLTLENEIGKRVVGQDVALNAIAQRLRAAKTGLTPRTVRRACSCWWARAAPAKPKPRWRWPMSVRRREITHHHQSLRIPGAAHRFAAEGLSAGLRRLRPGRILTEAVRKRPYSVVLLDEVEKPTAT
jgi:type VI secretion system protein VasG